MNSCSVFKVSVDINSLDQICLRSELGAQTPASQNPRFKLLLKGLCLLDLFLFFFSLHLSPELTRTLWPVTADKGDSLSFLLHFQWKGHDASGRKCSRLFITQLEYFILVLVWAACLDGTYVAVKCHLSFCPNRVHTQATHPDRCTFLFIRPKCSARQ